MNTVGINSRNQVLAAITTERLYQEEKWGTIADRPHEVGAWIALLLQHCNDALSAWSVSRGDAEALVEIRKVAALAVACGEQHGMPPRTVSYEAERQFAIDRRNTKGWLDEARQGHRR